MPLPPACRKSSMTANDVYPYLLAAVSRDNVLPVTSRCNLGCLFCSHRQNPPDIITYSIPPLSMDTILELAQFLDAKRKVIIGESATRLNEGEPFTHPEILALLQRLRRMLPGTILALTTNGTLLTEKTVLALAGLQPLELTVSLNSATDSGRKLLLQDPDPLRAPSAVRLLAQYHIPFHGSLVAMPHLTGWDDMEQTVRFLASAGALTIRVFLPGYTRLAPAHLHFPLSLWDEVLAWTSRLTEELGLPVIPEPALCRDLTAQIYGVIKNSPASAAGLQAGDIIATVNGRSARTRVEAYRLAQRAKNPELTVLRQGHMRTTALQQKNKGQSPGFVMHYDFDPHRMDDIAAKIALSDAKRPLLLCSAFAFPLLTAVAAGLGLPVESVQSVPSLFFGGSIQAAGLLTTGDFLAAAKEAAAQGPYDLILIPREAVDLKGLDLRGQSPADMAALLSIPVHAV